MSTDWRELLDRLIEGETLSDAEARSLAEALDAPPGRGEAAEWLRFEAALRERLARPEGDRVALSRERLLAKAALREKRAAAERPSDLASLPKASALREGIPGALPAPESAQYPPEGAIREKPSGGKSLSWRAVAVAAVALLAIAAGILAGVGLLGRRAPSPPIAEKYA